MKIPLDKFEDWLINKNLKERTVENYIYYFNKFSAEVFNQESISKFISQKGNRNGVCRAFLKVYKQFLLVNYKELKISDDLRMDIVEVEFPALSGRLKSKIVRPLSHEQIPLLEKTLETEKLKIQLLFSYYCALRLGELLKIRLMSFDWEKWKKDMEKMGECLVYGKGDKEGIALVPSFLMKRIAIYVKANKFNSVQSHLFLREGAKKIDYSNRGRAWQRHLNEAGVKAGITKVDQDGKAIKETVVHPHKLRHSYAAYLLNVKKLNIREVQEILRHVSIKDTERYTYIDKEDLKEKLQDET